MKTHFTKEQLEKEYLTENLNTTELANKYGVDSETIRHHLVKFGIPRRVRGAGGKNIISIEGKKFGRLLVIKKVINNKNTASVWECKCDCGNTTIVLGHSLRKGLTTSCGCVRIEKQLRYHNDLSYSMWNRIITGALSRGLSFDITIEDAWKQYIKQDKKCALSGLEINLVKNLTKDRKLNTASLDRIDSSKGYTKDNIQWLHKDINILKNNYTEKEFLFYCRKIVEYADKPKTIN